MVAPASTQSLHRRKVSTETVIFATICLADLISTVILVQRGVAIESNPLLAPTMRLGISCFVVVKLASFLVPLALVEMLRPKSPAFCQLILRVGIVGYLAVYVIGSLRGAGMIRW